MRRHKVSIKKKRTAANPREYTTFEPYYGQKAQSETDPATKVKIGPVPLNAVLSLFHQRWIGRADTVCMLDLVNHMTPGMEFWMGFTSPLPKYTFDVCLPELRKQLREIAAVPLPDNGDLDRFYKQMVKRFGKTVNVRSIAKPIA